MPSWTVQSFAYGSLLTASKMEAQYANIDFVRQAIMNSLTDVGTLDLTQSPTVIEIAKLLFQAGTGLGADLNGRTLKMGGGPIDMEGGTIINEGVSGLPQVLAGGLTINSGSNAGELYDQLTSFDFSTDLTAGESFVSITNSYSTLLFHVTSLVDANTVLLGISNNVAHADNITGGTGYSVYNNLYKLDFHRVGVVSGGNLNYTPSSNDVGKIAKVEFRGGAGATSQVVTMADSSGAYVTPNLYNSNSGTSVAFFKIATTDVVSVHDSSGIAKLMIADSFGA